MIVEVVSLDVMDWFEFEQFIAHLFELLDIGKTERVLRGSDAGRDIILRSNDGKIIVECKHHPKGTVGRPTVRKLHSAVIISKAKKGYLVTTGKFSDNATVYAKNLGSLFELIDLRILSDMAHSAGIRIIAKGEKTDIKHVLPPSLNQLENKMISCIIGNAISFPQTPAQL